MSARTDVDGRPLIAWLSEHLQSAGCVERDPVAALITEAARIARAGDHESSDYLAYNVRSATIYYAEMVQDAVGRGSYP